MLKGTWTSRDASTITQSESDRVAESKMIENSSKNFVERRNTAEETKANFWFTKERAEKGNSRSLNRCCAWYVSEAIGFMSRTNYIYAMISHGGERRTIRRFYTSNDILSASVRSHYWNCITCCRWPVQHRRGFAAENFAFYSGQTRELPWNITSSDVVNISALLEVFFFKSEKGWTHDTSRFSHVAQQNAKFFAANERGLNFREPR